MAVTVFGVMQIQLAAWLLKAARPDAQDIADRICLQLERMLCKPEEACGRRSRARGAP